MATSKHSDNTAEKPNAKWYGSAASANNAYAARLSVAGKRPSFRAPLEHGETGM